MEKKMKKEKKRNTFWKDFKAFISKGNIIDLAVAVIIGGAFGKIVTSLVNDIVMPLISLIAGGADVSDWKWIIKPATFDASGGILTAESALKYGSFFQSIIDFLIIAFFIFLALRIVTASQRRLNKLAEEIKTKSKKVEQQDEIEIKEENIVEEKKETQEDVLKEIRDLLKTQTKQQKTKKTTKI